MSLLTLQIGQCGNQIGPVFFNTIASAYCSTSGTFYEQMPWNPFFRVTVDGSSVIARSVLIDMEPSVVQSAYSASQSAKSQWTYNKQSCVKSQSGSGNNWAMGYLQHGPEFRIEIFGGFLLIHSVAGGTGSGLGAYLTKILANEFPRRFLMNYCIWPFELGEVTVQSYNALLTLNALMESSHGVLMAENDTLANLSQTRFQTKHSSFTHMNTIAMEGLASCLLPTKVRSIESQENVHGWTPGNWTRVVSDLLYVLCPNSKQKLISCVMKPQMSRRNAKYSVLNWNTLLEQIATPLGRTGMKLKHFENKSNANYLFLHGKDSLSTNLHSFRKKTHYPHSVERLGVSYSPEKFLGLTHSISLMSNSQRNILPVIQVHNRAKQMFKTKAFIHSYESYGLTQCEFLNAFNSIKNELIESYLN